MARSRGLSGTLRHLCSAVCTGCRAGRGRGAAGVRCACKCAGGVQRGGAAWVTTLHAGCNPAAAPPAATHLSLTLSYTCTPYHPTHAPTLPHPTNLQRQGHHAKLHGCVALHAQRPPQHRLGGGGGVGQQQLGPHAQQAHAAQRGCVGRKAKPEAGRLTVRAVKASGRVLLKGQALAPAAAPAVVGRGRGGEGGRGGEWRADE